MTLSTMMNYPLTLDHILDRAGRLYADTEIVSRLPNKQLHRYTYADFHRRSKALAKGLVAAGLRPGDRVATLMWNHYAHFEAYFGVPAAGGVLHTLNLRLTPDDLAYIVNHAADRFLLVDEVLLPLLDKFIDKVKLERIWVLTADGGIHTPAPKHESYEALIASGAGDFTWPAKDENSACAMCYTSGTTGHPKGVVYSHRSTVLHAFAAALPNGMNVSMADAATPVVPMFHANAWGLPYVAALVGAKLVFPGPHLDAENLLDLFTKESVTMSAGVPTIWLNLLQTIESSPQRWSLRGLRLLVGGSAVPESMIRRFDAIGVNLLQGWGMTETSPLATVSRLKPKLIDQPKDIQYAQLAKQGLTMPFVDIRLCNDEGHEMPWDGQQPGEIQVRGPWITASYYKLADSSDKFTPDGWLRTGDVGVIDTDGYLKLVDRTKDLIKSGGEWISSVDLENALMGHPAVAEATVIAIPHPKWDERPLAIIVKKSGSEVTAEELTAYLTTRFAKWMLPDDYRFVSEIAKTSTGKFNKKLLREQHINK